MRRKFPPLRAVLLGVAVCSGLWYAADALEMIEQFRAGPTGVPGMGVSQDEVRALVEQATAKPLRGGAAQGEGGAVAVDPEDLVIFTPDGREITPEMRERLLASAAEGRANAMRLQGPRIRVSRPGQDEDGDGSEPDQD